MLYLRSASVGQRLAVRLTVTFAIGTDPDLAAINVDNRVQSRAAHCCPRRCAAKASRSRKRSSTHPADRDARLDRTGRYDELFVSNYATLNVIDELRRIPGVGDAQIFGARDYSIRIWLQPDRLAQLGLTPADVAAAVREQNVAVRRRPARRRRRPTSASTSRSP